jgi:signal recognition particle subunit SRP54
MMGGLGQMLGMGGGAPSPEMMKQIADKMPGGAGGLPPNIPGLPGGLPGLGGGKLPGLGGLPGLGTPKKK